ncbi:outer membrane lipoprotein-sorting protein, partial [Treponema sp.]|uniref:outer membrane lipoprotein-sorting protein n=1 Tax=Treponema sp. TaxID=166 RepID=UPI00388D0DFC
EKNGREDDRWIYMPSLRQVRRIPMGERYKQFVGCEFTYNDMGVRNVEEDDHTLLESNVKVTAGSKNYTCWKIKSVPHKKSEVEYSYRIQYIDTETYLPAKIEYFDKKDQTKIMKTYTTEDWKYITAPKTGVKYTMRMRARIVNNITGRQTLLDIKDPKFDEGISAAYFTQQYLSTGKAK